MKAIVKLGMDKEEIRAFRKAFETLAKILDDDEPENEMTQMIIENMWSKEGVILDFTTYVEATELLSLIATDPYGEEYSAEDFEE